MIDVATVDPTKWQQSVVEVVPQHPVNNMSSCSIMNFKLACFYMENVSDKLVFYDFNTPANVLHTPVLPELGTFGKTVGAHNSTEFLFRFGTFTEPGILYNMNLDNYKMEKIS